ncbi:Mbov_0401 family ICE element transposase-like protein [Spiroplasma endosymbiont of Sarcophaga variegata]|uniref:Mbov_0401 family ICE element transposase-like protein n=1 Tax=Spiroplasma endosymbiont of Sarcophaga variegata TaxID=3066304 RepID=UPI003AF4B213
MELKQNLLGNYKENKKIQTKNEINNFLIERDNEIFKLYQQGKILQGYKVVSKIPKTFKTEYGDNTVKRRRYVKYDEENKKYINRYPLDEELGLKKYERIEKNLKDKYMSFMGDGKRYKDILHTTENANISERTISNIFKNADLEETDYISNKNNNKIKIPNNVLYIQIDGAFEPMRENKKRVENKIFLATMHVGVDEEKSTKTRIKMKKKKGVFQMMNKNHKNKNDKSNIDNFIDKIFKSMDTYDINEDTKILILSDGEKQIKKIYKAVKSKYKNNTVSYSLDKFHLVKRFKELFPNSKKNRIHRLKYKLSKIYFFTGNYEALLDFLMCHLPYVIDNKKKFLLETIELIKNNKEGIENQALEYNIGCHMEGDISHYIKAVKGRGAKIYCKETFINMLIASMLRLNSKTNEEKINKTNKNKEKIEFNIFNLNQSKKQFLSL